MLPKVQYASGVMIFAHIDLGIRKDGVQYGEVASLSGKGMLPRARISAGTIRKRFRKGRYGAPVQESGIRTSCSSHSKDCL